MTADTHPAQTESSESFGIPPTSIVQEMARQLDTWRTMLPEALQWNDGQAHELHKHASFNGVEPMEQLTDAVARTRQDYDKEILISQLRTRYYCAHFLLYRPFLFKAIHFPEHMQSTDTDCCELAIQSVCRWPIAAAPMRDNKRLVPHMFSWTQNFLSVLLVLRMTREDSGLRQICEERIGQDVVNATVAMLLDWLEDVKRLDGIAEWSSRAIKPLFADEEWARVETQQ